jgi:ClpP class serine protease
MGYAERRPLYRAIERASRARVIAYVTGDRPGMQAQVSPEAVELIVDHLEALGRVRRLALVLMTDGGSSAAAWRLANLLRQWADAVEVWIPGRALSAGTMIAIGAGRIVMARSGVLGPIDPSLIGPLGPVAGSGGSRVPVSVEAVTGYLEAAQKTMGITEDPALAQVLVQLAGQVHPLVLGQVFRSREQARAMAFRLLAGGGMAEAKRARIADFLCSETGSHDYTIGAAEAAALGLPVEVAQGAAARALAAVRGDVIAETEARTPFVPEQLMACGSEGAAVEYRCVRALVESLGHGAHQYLSEGALSRGEDGAVRDRRRCEGWRKVA